MCRFVPVVEGFHLANFVYISKFPSPFSLFLVTPGVIVINISHFVYRREMRGADLIVHPFVCAPFSQNAVFYPMTIFGLSGANVKIHGKMFPILSVCVWRQSS